MTEFEKILAGKVNVPTQRDLPDTFLVPEPWAYAFAELRQKKHDINQPTIFCLLAPGQALHGSEKIRDVAGFRVLPAPTSENHEFGSCANGLGRLDLIKKTDLTFRSAIRHMVGSIFSRHVTAFSIEGGELCISIIPRSFEARLSDIVSGSFIEDPIHDMTLLHGQNTVFLIMLDRSRRLMEKNRNLNVPDNLVVNIASGLDEFGVSLHCSDNGREFHRVIPEPVPDYGIDYLTSNEAHLLTNLIMIISWQGRMAKEDQFPDTYPLTEVSKDWFEKYFSFRYLGAGTRYSDKKVPPGYNSGKTLRLIAGTMSRQIYENGTFDLTTNGLLLSNSSQSGERHEFHVSIADEESILWNVFYSGDMPESFPVAHLLAEISDGYQYLASLGLAQGAYANKVHITEIIGGDSFVIRAECKLMDVEFGRDLFAPVRRCVPHGEVMISFPGGDITALFDEGRLIAPEFLRDRSGQNLSFDPVIGRWFHAR
ncbi:hypothetical protein [Paracoccus versutus]|uniref:hypothetical protein n=1 Tax=Paracoccus versutus TaxID=34007 RepID=UPI0012EE9CEF|nr:hypothetical protein [Paracoccus versutus]